MMSHATYHLVLTGTLPYLEEAKKKYDLNLHSHDWLWFNYIFIYSLKSISIIQFYDASWPTYQHSCKKTTIDPKKKKDLRIASTLTQ